MLEIATMAAFTLILIACIGTGASIVFAMAAGYVLFFAYGLMKKHAPGEILRMSFSGVRSVRNILIIFLLIGMITALWRASGTIPVIICMAAGFVRPSVFILITFLLNCMVSVLTGTAFGTAATMGVICMSMASAMGINPVFCGGAVISGIFFGDRCSPVSTSALLVSELTSTDIYENIRRMTATALVPFLISCLIYGGAGFFFGGTGEIMDVEAIFSGSFFLHWILVLPAASILILSLFRVNVKITMAVSIILSFLMGIIFQKTSPAELAEMMVFGYSAEDPELAGMLNGGGITSMVRVALIVSLSSSYAGIFEGTGLLTSLKRYIASLGKTLTPFGGILAVSAVTSMISCNQTLAAMLTHQLCRELEPDRQRMAIHLENSVIVMAPLVPWSIAGAVPLATIGAPMAGLAAACYLYLVPLWNLLTELRKGWSGSAVPGKGMRPA